VTKKPDKIELHQRPNFLFFIFSEIPQLCEGIFQFDCGIIISNLINATSSKTQKLCIFSNAQKPFNFAPFRNEYPQKTIL